MSEVEIWIAGVCPGGKGYGGWGAILKYGVRSRVIDGHAAETTAEMMRAMAITAALSELKRPCAVTIYSERTWHPPDADGFSITWSPPPTKRAHPNVKAVQRVAHQAAGRAAPKHKGRQITQWDRAIYQMQK